MFVVTLPASARKDPRAFSQRARTAGAQILEIRGDLTPDLQPFDSALPLLASPRSRDQTMPRRLSADYVDLELDEEADLPDDFTLIRSVHRHDAMPELDEMEKIMRELLETECDIVKIAITIRSYDDLRRLEELRMMISPLKRQIVLGMGPMAHRNRMLSPLMNALTYTFLDDGEQAAPGQVPLSMYRLTANCSAPKIYGLVGGMECVKSLSPLIHNTLFQRHEIDAMYVLYPTESLEDFSRSATLQKNQGLSITAPWKKDIMQYAESLDPLTKKLGSMNTGIKKDGQWTGYNTDVMGIEKGYDWSSVKSVAILGSGGVVPAVIEGCRRAGVRDITIFARSASDSADLASRFQIKAADLATLSDATVDAVVCTISDDVDLPLPQTAKLAIDLRYNRPTKFLAAATARGWHTADGLPMLIEQALEQFRLFTGITPSEDDRQEINRLTMNHAGRRPALNNP